MQEYSIYRDIAARTDGNIYIGVVGPVRTGKSTFMKRIAKACLDRGYKPHICPCSSDPDSLDLVVVPETKIVIMDGTAPHTIDPKYAGAVLTCFLEIFIYTHIYFFISIRVSSNILPLLSQKTDFIVSFPIVSPQPA